MSHQDFAERDKRGLENFLQIDYSDAGERICNASPVIFEYPLVRFFL